MDAMDVQTLPQSSSPLTPTTAREPLHTRRITLQGYKREDGLFDIEGHLIDTKSIAMTVSGGERAAGEPIHSMWLRITVDGTLTIVDAQAVSEAMPYRGFCDQITPTYKQLIGLAIRPGFSNKVRELFGGIDGCTHITELIGSLATTAFQTMAGQRQLPATQKPYQLDRCHALRSDGPVVAKFYPKWYVGNAAPQADAPTSNEP
jgi:Protein of unknown function (DUF2889)